MSIAESWPALPIRTLGDELRLMEFYRMITDAEATWLREHGAPEARKSWRVKVGQVPGGRIREFLVPGGPQSHLSHQPQPRVG
jgi:hypothetical protein